MDTYSVTVNGVTYEVEVEKKGGASAGRSSSAGAPKPVSISPPKPAAASTAVEGIKITAGAAGKIWKIIAKEGQAIKLGAPVVILEAMKMEIPVVAPQDGIVSQIFCSEGDPVEAGDLIATMN